MSELEEKLNSVLSNPQLMQQIMSMAQNMNNSAPSEPPGAQEPLPELDINLIRQLSGMAQKGTIDRNQQSLLKALGPYLSPGRISKLEKAMRAAKMAQFATVFLNSSQFQSGR
jgi:hypothetical protein